MPAKESMDEKMDQILEYLHRMDKRDRLRTWGGFFRGLLGIVPVAVLLWSVWYAYEYGDELLEKITKQAAQQAAEMTEQQSSGFMEKFNQYLGQ